MESSIEQTCPRIDERRTRRFSLRLRERRSGFDRRTVPGRMEAGLLELRDSAPALAVLLVALNVMNVMDQIATTRALAAGFSEGNPVMAALIAADPALAAVVKISAVLAVSASVWALRRYRAVLVAAVLMFAMYAAVLLLHYYGSAFFY